MRDANTATERGKLNDAKLPQEKTGGVRRKGERNKEERETLKLAAEPTAKTATCETENMDIFRIAPNV